MDDIRFLGTDGEFLVLESANGEKYRLLVDEFLRKAVRRDSAVAVVENQLTPRAIQTAVRRGATIDELLGQSTSSRAYIEKFAGPVLDELQHIISSALSVRVSIAGDRFNETSQAEFGEILADRLAQAGAHHINWSSRKNEHDVWLISCSFEHGTGKSVALWSFVPKRLAIAAENDVAVALSNQSAVVELPKLRSLENPKNPNVESTAEMAARVESTLPITPIPATWANPNETANLAETIEFQGVIPFGRSNGLGATASPKTQQPEQPATAQPETIAESEDLLESLRRRRVARENAANLKTSDPQSDDIIEAPASKGAPLGKSTGEKTSQTKAPNTKGAASPKRGRPSIPSWDEIVFGSNKSEE